MKILQITPTLYPTITFGGGSYVAWDLSKALTQKGHRVTIVSTDAGDRGRTKSGRFEQDGVEIVRAKNLAYSLAHQFKLFMPLISPVTIRKAVRDCDVVHLHDYRTVLNIITALIAIDEGKPMVVQPHGTIRGDYLTRKSLKRMIDMMIGGRIAPNVNAWVALSEVEREHLIQFGLSASKVHVLPNGIDSDDFQIGKDKATARKELGLDPNERILLYVGRIHEFKGIDLLIDCLSDVLMQERNVSLIIAGPDDGALNGLVKKARDMGLSNRIAFKGIISAWEKATLLRAADAFILPSKMEAFPIALLGACAAGIPVVTTNNSDVARDLNNICGLTVERDRGNITQAILRVLREKDMADRFSEAGKKHASGYSWSNVVPKYIELYQTLLR